MSDKADFRMMQTNIRNVAAAMLRHFFGERCHDFEPDCECCKRWKALDALTANPFEERENREAT